MRTKALLLAAAIVAGGAITGAAQTVYSINAVGYVNLTIPAGFSMIGNPLNTTNNTVETLIPAPPMNTTVYKWDGTSFTTAVYLGVWLGGNLTLNPGEGCWINTSDAFTNTFVGEVVQSPDAATPLTNSIPSGFSIRSSIVPQEGSADELALTSSLSTVGQATVYKWDTSVNPPTYQTALFFGGGIGWLGTPPSFKVGEAFWVNSDTSANWTRIFTINTP
jgi:hypothetical protein